MTDIRIQFVNYKTRSYLIECLQSLQDDLKSVLFSYSIAIVDNASGDDLADLPTLFPQFNLEIYQREKNGGFGSGHNFLAKKGEARFLLLLNPDTKIIEPNTISRLLERIQALGARVVGPRLVNKDLKVQLWDHGELHGFLAWAGINSGNAYWREQKIAVDATWVSGAVFLMDKEWFDKLGGFDENFFLYKEEEELCFRMRAMGGKAVYDPSITVLHYGSVVAKKSDHFAKSQDYFLKKHFLSHPGYFFFKHLNRFLNFFSLHED